MLLLRGVAALLLLGGVSAATGVPPPTDVTVSCHNANATVSWSHGEEAETSFRVALRPSDRRYETTARRFELGPLVWGSADSSMGFHYVTVTAVRGCHESEPVDSPSFSFNPLKTVHVECQLHFPPVELVAGDSGVTVGFPNPLHFYRELHQVAKQDGVAFRFRVSAGNESFDAACSARDATCRRDVWFPEGAGQRVRLQGRLCSRDCLGEVAFRDTECVFAGTSDSVLGLTLALMVGVLAFVVLVAAVAISRVRGWTMRREEQETPDNLKFDPEKRQLMYDLQGRDAEETSPVVVVQSDSCSTAGGPEDDGPPSCGGPQSSDEGYRDGGLSEDSGQGSACRASRTDDSEQTECVSVDSEDGGGAEGGGYDSPHLLDMGDGEMVSYYSGR